MVPRAGILLLPGAVVAATLAVTGSARAQGLTAVASAGLGSELTCIHTSHRDPNFVLVGTANGQILRTVDGGATWQRVTVTQPRTLFWGRERTPNPAQQYALGLPGKAPLLQSWLRRQGLTTSGINLQQLLVTKGDKMVAVNWIEVDWHDDDRVYVGTVDGLYRSVDRGRTFVRIFQGYTSAAERMVNTVATDPHDPKTVMIGTASGLFVSHHRGVGFRKTMNYFMREAYIREIWFDPDQKGLVHVAMGGSAMASPDGGKHWITTHWDEWGPRADVQSLSLGPGNLRLIGTRDGVYASWQGGEMGTWKRRGYRFIQTPIIKVLASDQPNIWLAMTQEALWVTADSGLNWKKIFHSGGREIPRWMTAQHGDLRRLWFVTNRQIYKLGLPELLRGRGPRRPRTSHRVRGEPPPLYDFVRRVLKHHRLWFPDNQRYRRRGPWAALLPSLRLDVTNLWYIGPRTSHDYLYRFWPYRYHVSDPSGRLNVQVMGYWDLRRLIFDKRELPHWGRIQRNIAAARQDITERIHRLYGEYRRIDLRLQLNPPENDFVKFNQELRLQEITAYFDGISGGHWSTALRRKP